MKCKLQITSIAVQLTKIQNVFVLMEQFMIRLCKSCLFFDCVIKDLLDFLNSLKCNLSDKIHL